MDNSDAFQSDANNATASTGESKTAILARRSVTIAGVALCVIHLSALIFTRIDGHDASIHFFWMRSYCELFGKVSWWPRWSPLSFYGMGSPVFYFYPPLTYIVAAVISWLLPALTIEALFKVIAAGAYLLAFFSMRMFLRSTGATKRWVLAGSLLYTFNPYLYFTLFSRSSLTEHVSFAIIPLIFYAIHRIITERSLSFGFLLLSFGVAAVILTSIPSASAILIVLGVIVLLDWQVNWRSAVLLLLGIFLGCSTAAISLIPAWAFQGRLQTQNMWPVGDHSPLMEAWNSGYLQSRLLLPSLFVTLMALWLLARYGTLRPAGQGRNIVRQILWGASTVVLILQLPFVISVISPYFLPLRLIQYPWRLNTLAFFFACTFIVLGKYNRIIHVRVLQIVLVGWVASVLVIEGVTLMGMRSGLHQRGSMDTQAEFYSRSMTIPADSVGPAIRATAFEPAIVLSHTTAQVTNSVERPYERDYTLNLTFPDTATLHLYYWPEWVARVNGSVVPTSPDSLGRTVLALPAGISKLDIRLNDSAPEKIGRMITFVSIILVFLTAFAIHLRGRHHTKES